jgi:hypothetical protein
MGAIDRSYSKIELVLEQAEQGSVPATEGRVMFCGA